MLQSISYYAIDLKTLINDPACSLLTTWFPGDLFKSNDCKQVHLKNTQIFCLISHGKKITFRQLNYFMKRWQWCWLLIGHYPKYVPPRLYLEYSRKKTLYISNLLTCQIVQTFFLDDHSAAVNLQLHLFRVLGSVLLEVSVALRFYTSSNL
jgi:hypothetical protein